MTPVRQYLHGITAFRAGHKKPEGWQYTCMEEYVDRNGVEFQSQSLTTEEKALVCKTATRTRSKFALKECFYNAQLLAIHDVSGSLVYHEGWAFSGILPVQHAWVTIHDKVVDLTWRLNPSLNKKGRFQDRVLGTFPEEYEYIGVPISDKTGIFQLLADRGWAGSILDDWENRWPLLRGCPIGTSDSSVHENA